MIYLIITYLTNVISLLATSLLVTIYYKGKCLYMQHTPHDALRFHGVQSHKQAALKEVAAVKAPG